MTFKKGATVKRKVSYQSVFRTALLGTLMGMVFAATFLSGRYFALKFNLGDAAILCIALVVPLKLSIPAAGVGSMLADLALSAPNYMPFTLVLKSALALLGSRSVWKKGLWPLAGMALGEGVVLAGYYVVDWKIYFNQQVAIVDAYWTAVQCVAGIAVGGAFLVALNRHARTAPRQRRATEWSLE